jgi:hypothetical protein
MKTNQDDLLKTAKEEMMAMVDAYHERMMACLGKMEEDTEKTEPDPGMMQSTEKHQEIPKGEATVMPVGESRKRRRVRSLAAERRQKRKERTRGNHGSRRKSAAACRKVSRCARVAWHKKRVVRKIGTQENCGPRKEFAAAGIRATRCAKVTRRKGRSHEGPSVQRERRKTQTRKKFARASRKGRTLGMRQLMRLEGTRGQTKRGTPKRRKEGERLWKCPQYSNGTRSCVAEEQIHLRKGLKTAKSIGGRRRHQQRMESMGNGNKVVSKTTRLEISKRISFSTQSITTLYSV